ncbi:MAG TPA: hypothetical protein VHG92_00885 [Afifellaceae bacterium]|nr:hypothetical protein [Afifellaceae bacterium]
MRTLAGLFALMLLVSSAHASRDCDFEKLQEEIRWCLVEAPDGTPGRERMVNALQREGLLSDLYQFRIGYAECHDRDQDKLSNFLECRRDDPIGLFNFGRQLLELPPISEFS